MDNTVLKVYNDGKEKHMSFEAYFDLFKDGILDITGYGEDKDDAIDNLKKKISDFVNQIDGLEWDNPVDVDYYGDVK